MRKYCQYKWPCRTQWTEPYRAFGMTGSFYSFKSTNPFKNLTQKLTSSSILQENKKSSRTEYVTKHSEPKFSLLSQLCEHLNSIWNWPFFSASLCQNNFLRVWSLKGLKLVFSKRCASKIWRGSVRSDFKKLDSFTSEMSKNHRIRNFVRNGRVRVNSLVLPTNFKCRSLELVDIFRLFFNKKLIGSFFLIFISPIIISENVPYTPRINPQAPVAQKNSDEMVFRHFQAPQNFWCATYGKYWFKPFQISFFSGFLYQDHVLSQMVL